jgi:hypothetical protein
MIAALLPQIGPGEARRANIGCSKWTTSNAAWLDFEKICGPVSRRNAAGEPAGEVAHLIPFSPH